MAASKRMKQLFQKELFPRIVNWNLRTLHNHHEKVAHLVSREDLQLGTSKKLINSNVASFIKNCPFLLQKSNSCLLDESDSGKAVYYRNPFVQVTCVLPESPEQRIQELFLPFYPSSIPTVIGDCASHEPSIGDDIRAPLTLHCKRILKIRRKKMKKHKYRKRRKLNLYKRRSLKILREKRKKREKREEERKVEWEKAHAD